MQLILFIKIYHFPHNIDSSIVTIDSSIATIDSKTSSIHKRETSNDIKTNNTTSIHMKMIDSITNSNVIDIDKRKVINSSTNTNTNITQHSNVIDTTSTNQLQLYPGWEQAIKSGDSISFKKLLTSDPDVSFWYSVEDTLHSAEYIQQYESSVVSDMIRIIKSSTSNEKCNFIDIGSNGGFFSLLGRSLGCRTIAVDAQPWCLIRLSSSASVNGYSSDFGVKWGAVSDQSTLSFNVGATKCSGLWSASNESDWINKESTKEVKVTSISMESIMNNYFQASQRITMMKIDAEGSEMNIIKSALPFLKDRRILNIVVEIAPNRVKSMTSLDDVKEIIRLLDEYNYEMTSYGSTSAETLRSQLQSPQKFPTGDNMFKISLKL